MTNNLLKGSKITLTSFKEEYMNKFENWYNDVSFLRNYDMISAFPRAIDELKPMIDDVKKSPDKFIFAIINSDDNKFIGVTGFEDILWNNGAATIYIGIGDSSNRGNGIGTEALNLTMEFGFEELNLHRIQLTVLSYNTPAIKLYEKLGFKKEGTYREFIHRDNRRYDMYLYGILRSEWEHINKY
ncbi:RimJ/RimL family protein N-acetyltransferase [Clostridium algifaecis]|uniref:RimJ/RimL family protein N-acetyltransferase n=1 Tax=Clostridium algifaecis TaxID=1472040 RepID=A0ABS4KVX1_9CLOT|nr:GNAT family protein [Clostridium algifaecis]MBP2033576.1 RimJ/RimL family protein N-acetyltransferase [Clostridium algifaecis]